jgi:hypothetical protein
MRKLLVLASALCALLVVASPAAAAKSNVTCTGVMTSANVRSVNVPTGASCTLVNSTVRDDVTVGTDAFLQATNTDVGGDVRGRNAQTVFVDTGSSVGDDVSTRGTAEVFVFGSVVSGEVRIYGATQRVNVCGNTVRRDLSVTRSARDILVGDPQAQDCAGNRVQHGDLEVSNNDTDVELVVAGNKVIRGDLEVNRNDGTSDKSVRDNIGGDTIACFGNDNPFVASGNTGFDRSRGQCD